MGKKKAFTQMSVRQREWGNAVGSKRREVRKGRKEGKERSYTRKE